MFTAGIQHDLTEVFNNLTKRAAAFGNDDYTSNLCFQEETLGDFMQLMKVITMCSVLTTSTNYQQTEYLGRILNFLTREASRRARTRRTCVVYMSILYVSRFRGTDWAPVKQRSPHLSAAFEDLVDILNGLEMKIFNFAIKGSVYRRQCEEFVKEVLGASCEGTSDNSQHPRHEHAGRSNAIIVDFSKTQDGPNADYPKQYIPLATPDPVHITLTPGSSGVKIKRYAVQVQKHPVNYSDPFVKIAE
jgi:hypothetical protein